MNSDMYEQKCPQCWCLMDERTVIVLRGEEEYERYWWTCPNCGERLTSKWMIRQEEDAIPFINEALEIIAPEGEKKDAHSNPGY